MKSRREDWPAWAREILSGIRLLHEEAEADRERLIEFHLDAKADRDQAKADRVLYNQAQTQFAAALLILDKRGKEIAGELNERKGLLGEILRRLPA